MKFLAILFLMLFALQDNAIAQKPRKTVQEKTVILPTAKPIKPILSTEKLAITELSVSDFSVDEINQSAILRSATTNEIGLKFENGAFVFKTKNFSVPLSGGGASGCFNVSTERNLEIQKQVRAQFEKEKSEAEKKK